MEAVMRRVMFLYMVWIKIITSENWDMFPKMKFGIIYVALICFLNLLPPFYVTAYLTDS